MPPSVEKSAEQMRLVLPLLSQHASDFGPRSYALWFHYVAGIHATLRAALKAVVDAGARLTAQQTDEFYDRHVAQEAERLVEQLRAGAGRILQRLGATTTEAGASTQELLAGLATARARLDTEAAEVHDLTRVVVELERHAVLTSTVLARLDSSITQESAAIDELRREVAAVREAAMTDALTNVPNRRAFDQRLEAAVRSAWAPDASPVPPVLVMIDIDHFKRINDIAGHVFGDRVLRTVADALRANLKGRDFIARYGGEEFAIILERTTLPDAAGLAEQLRQAIGAIRIRRQGDVVSDIRISAGVGALRPDESPVEFVERVDAALYEAKRSGRNRVALARKQAALKSAG